MKKLIFVTVIALLGAAPAADDAKTILEKVDRNMSSKNRIVESSMTIHGKRSSRTITSKTWSEGTKKSFTEYLSPASEKGTKMLKLDNQLWMYSPSTDRIIQISGHMLRQSVMGSDLSYEDMMDDRKLTDVYNAEVLTREKYMERNTTVLKLTSKTTDLAYAGQKLWIDQERFVPLKQELYGKSGQLLKRIELSEVKQVQGRWFPHKMTYKDVLKQGKGTEFTITSIKFDQEIPAHIFTKASLK
ncbi:MAG TPA: outer membrane lipoprotein-sorting protein [Bacteroidales bacterium]|nr:outer membrane lipoprotein-sorting protein [Bacteroidales bacterium]HRZ48803.1 outer membrane lipoprotein-sorting protein [Bacteroidales bacterium]